MVVMMKLYLGLFVAVTLGNVPPGLHRLRPSFRRGAGGAIV